MATSAAYTLKETFIASKLPVSEMNVFGFVSLIIWALLLVVPLKYVLFILRANNQETGGVIVLTQLALLVLFSSPNTAPSASARCLAPSCCSAAPVQRSGRNRPLSNSANPHILPALCSKPSIELEIMDTFFFLSRDSISVPNKTPASHMSRFRTRIFRALYRNSTPVTNYYSIPGNRVIEMSSQVKL